MPNYKFQNLETNGQTKEIKLREISDLLTCSLVPGSYKCVEECSSTELDQLIAGEGREQGAGVEKRGCVEVEEKMDGACCPTHR